MARQVRKPTKKSLSRPYRSLNVSDIHMSNSLPHAKPGENGVTDRLREQGELWERIFATAREKKVEGIFVQGDLFDHSRIDPITLRETLHALAKPPAPLFLIGGNHDGINTRGERFLVEAFDDLPDVHYMRTGEAYEPRPWLSFWPLEFSPLGKTREDLSRMDLDEDDVNVLLMHNSVKDCTHVGWTCDDGLDAGEIVGGGYRFDHILSGHFHDPQEFGKNGRYLGAPMHHRGGDEGRDAGYWIMEFSEDGKRKEEFIDGGCARFHKLDFDEDFGDDFIIDGESVEPGDYVRIKVSSTHAELHKLKPSVEELVAKLKGAGVRARWTHDPIYHHTRRIVSDDDIDGSGPISASSMSRAYVDAAEVDTSGLDLKTLRSVGREILEEAESKWQG